MRPGNVCCKIKGSAVTTVRSMKVRPLAGKPANSASLVNLPKLVTTYYTEIPDPSVPGQRVSFGTSGHRGLAFENSFGSLRVEIGRYQHGSHTNRRYTDEHPLSQSRSWPGLVSGKHRKITAKKFNEWLISSPGCQVFLKPVPTCMICSSAKLQTCGQPRQLHCFVTR